MNCRLAILIVSLAVSQQLGNWRQSANCAEEKSDEDLYRDQQESVSLSEAIKMLEASLAINPAQEGSAEQRIAALENRLLGATQSGSLVSRVQHLRQVNAARKAKSGKSADLSDYSAEAKFHGKDPLVGKAMKYLPLTNETSVNFVRIEPPGTEPDLSGDYFSAILATTKNKVIRFKRMPVPVFIAPGPDRLFTQACIGGFEMWEEKSQGLIRFVQVDDPDRARIKVTWGHAGASTSRGNRNVGARTMTKWTDDYSSPSALSIGGIPLPLLGTSSKYAARPQVIEVNLDFIYSKPEDLRMPLLQNVIAHELGHTLGILAHSPDRSDLMYAVTDEHSRISQRDINTLKRLYQSKVDVPL
jgi:hypothetical protein